MIEIQDSTDRLIVVLSMRVRHSGKLAYVFVDGRVVGEFPSLGEATKYARTLAQGRCVEQSGPPATLADD
jgi:prepilin-type processing-associated H-X9-DG protein